MAGPPSPLAPLSPQQITKQATSTITKSYAPEFQSLNQQQKTAQGLADKRSADNKFYQSWLDTNMQGLKAHADAADQHINDLVTNLTAAQSGLYAAQQPGLVAGADARPGNVSNNAQAQPFGAGGMVAQNEAANRDMLAGTALSSSEQARIGTQETGGALANTGATINDARIKQQTDLNTALTDIANRRSVAKTSEAGDIAKEIGRLQGIEISKAQSNRDYTALAAKFGLTAADTASKIAARAAAAATAGRNATTNQQRLGLDLTKSQQAQANSDRNYQLDLAKYNTSVAQDLYAREHGLGKYKPAKGANGTKPPLGQASQNAIFARIDTIRGDLHQLIAYGATPQHAWHILHDGGYFQQPVTNQSSTTKKGKTTNTSTNTQHNIYFKPVGDDGLLNAAFNTRDGAGGLTPGDVNYLHGLGLVIHGRLPIVPQPGAGAGNWRT